MFNYLEWFQELTREPHTLFVFYLCIIIIANVIDFLLGFLNAQFNKKIKFSSSEAILGLTRKFGIIALLSVLIPVSVVIPEIISIPALTVLMGGYIISELWSIASHLGFVKDNKKKQENIFGDMIMKMFKKG